MGKQCQTLFLGAPKSLRMVIAAMKLKDDCSLEGSYDQPRQHIWRSQWHPTPVLVAGKSMNGGAW